MKKKCIAFAAFEIVHGPFEDELKPQIILGAQEATRENSEEKAYLKQRKTKTNTNRNSNESENEAFRTIRLVRTNWAYVYPSQGVCYYVKGLLTSYRR